VGPQKLRRSLHSAGTGIPTGDFFRPAWPSQGHATAQAAMANGWLAQKTLTQSPLLLPSGHHHARQPGKVMGWTGTSS